MPKTTEREIKASKNFGRVLLLLTLAEQEGLRSRLRDVFGEDGDTVLALAIVHLIDSTAMRNMHLVLEDTFLPELLGLKALPGSQRTSELLASLGQREAEVRSFLCYLATEKDALAFDLTSLSSYSR